MRGIKFCPLATLFKSPLQADGLELFVRLSGILALVVIVLVLVAVVTVVIMRNRGSDGDSVERDSSIDEDVCGDKSGKDSFALSCLSL